MKRKSIVSGLLVFVLAAMAVTGCGKNTSVAPGANGENANNTVNEDKDTGLVEAEITTDYVISYDEVTDSSIFVEKVDGLSEDFARGVDVSSYLSEVNSGVKFYDFDGNELGNVEFFEFLASCGINWVRLRVWNDPFDADGNGYGGGNNDINAAITMGKWATEAGMKVLIDFHYSDFWADPSKQMAPKAWDNMDLEEKKTAAADFTKESLDALFDAGVNVKMIQVGNETTSGMAGENNWDNYFSLISSICNAVDDYRTEKILDFLIAVHFTNPEKKVDYLKYATALEMNEATYDVFASSYYPYWHGTLENLTSVLSTISNRFDKKVMVAETSWAYTLDNGDGHGNTVSVGSNDSGNDYAFTVQGQANEVREVINAVNEVGEAGFGVFYWEPAWIPVNYINWDEAGADALLEDSKSKWEEFGSGWASSYAKDYDPNDAGLYYGGSAVDNQAMFDFTGKPLDSLNVWGYVYSGASCPEAKIDAVGICETNSDTGVDYASYIPKTVVAMYNDGTTKDVEVQWDLSVLDEMTSYGVYTVNGTVVTEDATFDTRCTYTLSAYNFLVNGDFESGHDAWEISGNGIDDHLNEDPMSGEGSLHFYSEADLNFTASQNVIAEMDGNMGAYMYLQGGDMGDGHAITFTLTNNTTGESLSDELHVDGWRSWQTTTLTPIAVSAGDEINVTINGVGAAKGWGSIDDVFLYYEK